LAAPQSSNPAFRAELKTNQVGKEFQLVISTVPPLNAGNVQGQITLKSSSTNTPVITVTAWANVGAAVTVIPGQLTLPAAPPSSRQGSKKTARSLEPGERLNRASLPQLLRRCTLRDFAMRVSSFRLLQEF